MTSTLVCNDHVNITCILHAFLFILSKILGTQPLSTVQIQTSNNDNEFYIIFVLTVFVYHLKVIDF
jgi:hypothetical protein